MTRILLLLTMTAIALASDYTDFLQQYGKVHSPKRESIFYNNLAFIKAHNLDDSHTYKLDVNQFADLTFEEFTNFSPITVRNREVAGESPYYVTDPITVDWRQEGAVTPFKNQGHCGSCWTFSATGAMEGAFFQKTGKLYSLSEQQIVDCDTAGDGCQGGFARYGFQYAAKNGIAQEHCYPYTGQDGTCLHNVTNCLVWGITDYHSVESSTQALEEALLINPVSVAIYAAGQSFQFYSSGIYNDPECYKDRDHLDHAVLAVGYGKSETGDYWIVKNSWGESWGDNGYIMMARGNNMNTCGILDQPTYPTF